MRLFLLKKRMTHPHGSLKISEPSPPLTKGPETENLPLLCSVPSPPPLLLYFFTSL